MILKFHSVVGGTEDFRAIKPEAGSISDLEDLVKVAKEEGQQIFLELDPNHSSLQHPWFKRSVEREDPYTSYYVWADGITSPDGKERRSPPNNWVSSNRATTSYLADITKKIVECTYFIL